MSRASELEREVEASRAHLEGTVEALKDKMNVGDMVSEATRLIGDNGGADIVQTLARQARANPMPVALIGVGLAWLISGRGAPRLPFASDGRKGGRLDYERRYGTIRDDEYRRTFGEAVSKGASHPDYAAGRPGRGDAWPDNGAAGRPAPSTTTRDTKTMSERAGEHDGKAGAAARRKLHDAEESGSGVVSRISHAVSGAADAVTGAASSSADYAWRGGEQAYRGASFAGRRARRSFSEVLESEPLVIGAIGLAVGAAIGAMLPRTSVEDRYLGDARDRWREDAEVYARDMYEEGKAVAGEAYRTAKEEAEAQGLTSVSGFAENLSGKVGDVARAAIDQVKESAAEKGLTGDRPEPANG